MDKYRLVEEKFINAQGFIGDDKGVSNSAEEGGILRVTQQAKPRSCITDALNILVRFISITLQVSHSLGCYISCTPFHMHQERKKYVELKAMGKAINKAVTIAEILKRKQPLHQITTLSSCEIMNVYEPLEEGLDTVVNQHYVSCLTIILSEDITGIDVNDKGYQVSLSFES